MTKKLTKKDIKPRIVSQVVCRVFSLQEALRLKSERRFSHHEVTYEYDCHQNDYIVKETISLKPVIYTTNKV